MERIPCLVALIGVSLTACAGRPQMDSQSTPSPNVGTVGTLRYNIGTEPDSIDPAQDQDTYEDFVIGQLNATLVHPDKDLGVQPGLAQSWDMSADGLTYMFHLRPHQQWSDGSPLTAADFEYSFKRLFDPATASPYTDIVKGIKGADDYHSSSSKDPVELQKLRDQVGVKALDASTLSITLKEKEGFFLSTLFYGATAPVKQSSIQGNRDNAFAAAGFVGTGPFRLRSWHHKSSMELIPNPNYYGGAPKIDLTLLMISDPTAVVAAYKNNEIDTTGSVTLSSANIRSLRDDSAYRNDVLTWTQLGTNYLQYNVTKKPFDNPKLRVAISYAIDRAGLVDKVLAGVGAPATSLIPPGMPGHLDDVSQAYDVNKAKQLLAEAGLPDGKGTPAGIQASYNNSGVLPQIMQFLQANLAAIGIKISLDPRDPKTYFSQMRNDASPLFRYGWNADYPDPDDWYRVIFESDAAQNFGHWKNASYDKLVTRASGEPSLERRLELYRQAARIMSDDPPATWLYYSQRFALRRPEIKNMVTTAQDGGFPGKSFLGNVTMGD